ncbi:MAG: prohibitin family protein [Flavobacteriales bacterium]|nr:prohibitin family protein [Flavobacteriales bacterium]
MNQYEQVDISKYRPFIFIGLAVIILLIFASKTFIILEPTERGVVFKQYGDGLDVDNVLGQGLNIVAPWNKVIRFDIKDQQIEEPMDVLSRDGLKIDIDVTLRFSLVASEVGLIYEQFKQDYVSVMVVPQLRSAVREIIGKYTPEELYSDKRQVIAVEIEAIMARVLSENHLIEKSLVIRSIKLPVSIQKSIEDKLIADQEAQKYEYVLVKKKQEAEGRIIDAKGKAEANRILSASLTPNLLREKGIIATQKLAESKNSKTVIIGAGKDGLPLILGGAN